MIVKKFVAPTMPEAMKKVRAELGQDAVILNSKEIQTGGIFGFFTKKNIQVIAAIDTEPIKAKKQPVQTKIPQKTTSAYPNIGKGNSALDNQQMLQEIKQLKELVHDLSAQQQDVIKAYPEPLQKAYQFLISHEFEGTIIDALMEQMLEKYYTNKDNMSPNMVNRWLKDLLREQLSQYPFGGIQFTKKYINVVGPTGVGKTTTLAKLAALAVLNERKKVAFITTDTYRIAAIEQLKTYAQILEAPVEVAYNIEDFKKAKEALQDYDVIFIDTAGRNFRNRQYVTELGKVIDFNDEMETFLVLSLAAKYRDMKDIVEQFSLLKIDKFIFTKLDETGTYGAIFNLLYTYKIGVAYLTNGQNVPDDIIEATPEVLLNTLYGVNAT